MIYDARGNPVFRTSLDDLLSDIYGQMNKAIWGDGGPDIVAPDWKPSTIQLFGLSDWLSKEETYLGTIHRPETK